MCIRVCAYVKKSLNELESRHYTMEMNIWIRFGHDYWPMSFFVKVTRNSKSITKRKDKMGNIWSAWMVCINFNVIYIFNDSEWNGLRQHSFFFRSFYYFGCYLTRATRPLCRSVFMQPDGKKGREIKTITTITNEYKTHTHTHRAINEFIKWEWIHTIYMR